MRGGALLAVLALAACGGGGGSSGGNGGGGASGVTMSVSPGSITASAIVGQAAPSASFTVNVSGATTGQQLYLSGQYSSSGISDVVDSSGSFPDTITVEFKSPASLGAGTYTDTVQIDVCLDQACTQPVRNSPQTVQVTYTVQASSVTLATLAPASTAAGGAAFVLTVTGTNFTPLSTLQWNGGALITTYSGPTQLSAQVPASDIASAGTALVTVNDPSNGLSNSLNFNVLPPALGIRSISPAQVSVGGPGFMLTVLGSGYTSSSVVQWNGTARTTTLVSSGELVAQIDAADIATLGTAQITVHDPASANGDSAAQALDIVAVSRDAVSFQMNPAHTGSVSFNSVSFPTGSSWSVDVGGTPSYALIAQGLVIVTVSLSSGGSEIVALDQGDGHTVWGPMLIGSQASAAFDAGRVFFVSSPSLGSATMEAVDAGTGQFVWSALVSSAFAGASGVTATDGLVFASGTAFDQSSGAVVWSGGIGGSDSTQAVTADGLYVTFPCTTVAMRPATGEVIWSNNTGCEGGGGGTPVVANQLLYAPNGFATYSGSVFNAETGVSAGTYVSDNPGAFTTTHGYFLQGGTLRAVNLANNSVLWSFTGDGLLNTSPIAVNQYALVGSSSGNLYALDGTTGAVVWQQTLSAPFLPGAGWGAGPPFSGLAAGDGLLVVPTGTRVTAYLLSATP